MLPSIFIAWWIRFHIQLRQFSCDQIRIEKIKSKSNCYTIALSADIQMLIFNPSFLNDFCIRTPTVWFESNRTTNPVRWRKKKRNHVIEIDDWGRRHFKSRPMGMIESQDYFWRMIPTDDSMQPQASDVQPSATSGHHFPGIQVRSSSAIPAKPDPSRWSSARI